MLNNRHSKWLLSFSFLLGGFAIAAPGDLDPAFGTAGSFRRTGGAAKGVLVQANDKILIASAESLGENLPTGFGLTRLSADGTLDTTLDTDGLLVTSVGGSGQVGGMAVDPANGKIVVAGNSSGADSIPPYTYRSKFATVRYNADASVDTTFNGTGTQSTVFATGNSSASCAAVQADGKIIAAGFVEVSPNNRRFALARYNTNGSTDTTFNTTGTVVTDPASYCYIEAIAISPTDQKITVAGTYQHPTNYKYQCMIARYNPDGSLDTSFDTDGLVFTASPNGSVSAHGIGLQSDGKIVVGGSMDNPGTYEDFAIFRYNADGSLDTSFSMDGIVNLDFAVGYDSAKDVKILTGGKILVGGTAGGDYSSFDAVASFALVLLNADGSVDTAFGIGGKALSTGPSTRDMLATAQQGDGKVIAVGEFYGENSNPGEAAAVRYKLFADPPVATRKVDLRLGLTSAVPVGSNVYNTTGAGQTQSLTITSGTTRNVFIGVQNDGSAADSFKLKATAGDSNFTVTYFKGSQNITNALVAGTYNTSSLAAGATQSLKATIKAKTLAKDKQRTLTITATSVAKATVSDKVLIKATSKKKPK